MTGSGETRRRREDAGEAEQWMPRLRCRPEFLKSRYRDRHGLVSEWSPTRGPFFSVEATSVEGCPLLQRPRAADEQG